MKRACRGGNDMPEMSIPTTFSIDFISKPEKVNEFTSKVRARIYYKGGNRNGTWITDDFAAKLNSSVPHVPIVGTYNPETEDFEDHEDNGNKKAYGFVPSEPNSAWETGADGREYFSTDVILWTGYWPEAAKIVNKSQSMELSKESIMGDWKVISGDYYFVYQNASFKGLCALGDAVLPCFENSAFYTLDEESRSFFQSINKINENNLGGGNEKMEDNKEVVIDNVLETTVVEEVPVVSELTEDIAPTETDSFAEEVGMAPEGSQPLHTEDSVTIIESHREASANEDGSVTAIRTETIQTIDIETYYALQKENEKLTERIAALETENASLQVYKEVVVRAEKSAVVEQFKKKLTEEEVSEFVDNIDKYTAEELKTKLSILVAEKVLKEENTNSQPQNQFVRVPEKPKTSGIEDILRKNKIKR